MSAQAGVALAIFFSDLGAVDWLCIVIGSWLILAAVVAPCIGRSMRDEPSTDDDTVWLPFRPPVPPPAARSAHDTDWLADQPLEVTLTDTEVRLRSHDIELAEGWVSS